MNIFGTIRTWNRVRQTRNELNGLSNHELYDIGIDRSNIQSIAHQVSRS